MTRETALFRGCLSEEKTPAMPCLMWATDAMRGSGWDKRGQTTEKILKPPQLVETKILRNM